MIGIFNLNACDTYNSCALASINPLSANSDQNQFSPNAPINVMPVGGGGEAGHRVGI